MFARVKSFDARIKIILALFWGVLIWQVELLGLLIYFLFFAILFYPWEEKFTEGYKILRVYLFFIPFWTALKLLSDLMENRENFQILPSLLFGLRLLELLSLALLLALSSSARELGMAFAWFFRPFFKEKAWQVALALTLMIHFLPLSLYNMKKIKEAIERRCCHLSWHKKMLLLSQALIRSLSEKTWQQTIAIAARKLDQGEAWEEGKKFLWKDLCFAAMLFFFLLFTIRG